MNPEAVRPWRWTGAGIGAKTLSATADDEVQAFRGTPRVVRSQDTLLRVPSRVWHEYLRVETAAEFAVQRRPHVSERLALRPGLLRLILFDHDKPVAPFVQRVDIPRRGGSES
jgi:hypothetical protein